MDGEFDWDDIVSDLGPRLYAYFSARFPFDVADDLTQETLIRLVQKVRESKYDPRRGNLAMLAFGIGHYVALEHRGSQSRVIRLETAFAKDVNGVTEFESEMIQNDLLVKLQAQFKALSAPEQQILSLMIDDDVGISQISTMIRMPEGTIKSHIHRAKKKLSQFMSSKEEA
ncbi:MAG TPA: RNA polymerase sigma factor [Bdellovibrionales bacterium]|nr:RNA polymerase sigma factor [Bdellovibrionales bacterium]